MNQKNSVHDFLINMYGYTFFNYLMWVEPVYPIYMQMHGASDFGISSLLMLWSVGVIVTQLPIALLARRFGARNVLFAGLVIKAVAVGMWLVWPQMLGFAIGMFLWGMQSAIYSVVSEDVLYDELRARQNTLVYERVLGRRRNIATIGTACSAAGSLLMFFGYEWVTALSVVSLVFSMLFLTRMQLVQKYSGVQTDGATTLSAIKSAARVMRASPALIGVLIISVLVTNFAYLNDYLSLIGYGVGVPVEFVGIVPFFILMCQILGQGIAHRFVGMRPSVMFALIMVVGTLYGVFAVHYNMWGLFALGIAYVIYSAIKILLYGRFQNMTPSQNRMEVLSFYNIADQGTYLVMCLVVGLGSTLGGWRYSIAIMAVLLGMLSLVGLVFMRRHVRRGMLPRPAPSASVRPGVVMQ